MQRLLLYILCVSLLWGCEKDDSNADFGDALIYLPQASIAAGRYLVPNTGIGLDSATRNFQLTNDSVRVLLGVARSGKQPAEPYRVNVLANTDTVAKMITGGLFPAASSVLLPRDIYVLPAAAEVGSGQVERTFYLSIHRAKLKALAGKTVLLGVGINGADRYSVSPGTSNLVVVVNVNALNL